MAESSPALLIAVTWSVLLVLTLVNRYILKDAFIRRQPLTWVTAGSTRPTGTRLTRAGTLWVFLANIASMGLAAWRALAPTAFPVWLQFQLPAWLNLLGAGLFVIYSVWGWLVVVFNPNYTPCYRSAQGRFLLAVHGPYGVVRHPRYASEALMNIGFVLFTGSWVSLVGMAAWGALRRQAQAEEVYLQSLAGEVYSTYRARVGMFFPKKPGRV